MEPDFSINETVKTPSHRLFALLACAAPLFLASCSTCWRGDIPLRPQETTSLHASISDMRSSAKNVKVYQGLAHPVAQKELLAAQKAQVPYVTMHDFAFRKQPIAVGKDTVSQILNLYATPSSHAAWPGPKPACHGFHPDYALVWTSGGQQRELQLCYGCHEWKYYGPGGVFHSDISEPAYFNTLTKILPHPVQKVP